jgi:signal transduction histidine kinase
MNLTEFQLSQKQTAAPSGMPPALQALWYDAKGDWNKAHELAQEDAGDRASAVISRVRSLSKKMPYEHTLVNLDDIVADVMSFVRHEAASRQVNIQVNTVADLPSVRGDRVQLQQVLLNLVINGMEAMATIEPSKRTLIISGQREWRGEEPWCLMSIQDAGIGVTRNEVGRLFEAFYTTKPEGMGMGLAISRSIIEAHGGQLWLDPEEEAGTTFQFRLPAERGAKP